MPLGSPVTGLGSAWGVRSARVSAGSASSPPASGSTPGPAGDDEPTPTLLGFRVARVFDRSQTDGAELPEPARILAGEGSEVDLARLAQRTVELEFGLQFTQLWGTRNGDCSHALRRIRIRDDLPPVHKLKTLAHEMGHAVLHGPEFQGTRALAKLEAESVAYVVCRELNIDSSEYSLGYVASWSGGGPEAARLISATGSRILRGVETILGQPDPPSGSWPVEARTASTSSRPSPG